MNLTELTSHDLKKAVALMQQKETLQAKMAEVDSQLSALLGGKVGKMGAKLGLDAKRNPVVMGVPKPGRSGQVKEAIITLLKKVSPQGLSRKEICQRINSTPNRLNVWLHSTGKKIKQIKRIAPGTYAWIE